MKTNYLKRLHLRAEKGASKKGLHPPLAPGLHGCNPLEQPFLCGPGEMETQTYLRDAEKYSVAQRSDRTSKARCFNVLCKPSPSPAVPSQRLVNNGPGDAPYGVLARTKGTQGGAAAAR